MTAFYYYENRIQQATLLNQEIDMVHEKDYLRIINTLSTY
jgi:hypothetical protein